MSTRQRPLAEAALQEAQAVAHESVERPQGGRRQNAVEQPGERGWRAGSPERLEGYYPLN